MGPYIYDVSISGFTRSSIYIYDISSLRVKVFGRNLRVSSLHHNKVRIWYKHVSGNEWFFSLAARFRSKISTLTRYYFTYSWRNNLKYSLQFNSNFWVLIVFQSKIYSPCSKCPLSESSHALSMCIHGLPQVWKVPRWLQMVSQAPKIHCQSVFSFTVETEYTRDFKNPHR